ncbi:MAG: shikimate dehydrogenase [Lachnospiraceae bacterium]|nr:shikimate dehydrogenase [Lachnospiraceae bacterium]
MEYGLIGGNLSYSYSKTIHESFGFYSYELLPLSRKEFPEFMEKKAFKGVNVTIPYKREVIPYLSDLDDAAGDIGAVNTIVCKNGKLTGYNTDFSGFRYMLKKNGMEAAGKKVLILGTGGASAAVYAALKAERAGEILFVSRSGRNGALTYEEAKSRHTDAELIVNTTPVGTFPKTDESPLDLAPFTGCLAVADIVYNPAETRLTAQARALNINAATGLDMLIAQAHAAAEHFLERPLPDDLIEKAAARLRF